MGKILVKTDLNEIHALTDEQLDKEIEEIEKEIQKYDLKGDSSCTVVPAFDETIKYSAAMNRDVREFPFDRLGVKAQFDVITVDHHIVYSYTWCRSQLTSDSIGQIPLNKIL